jgi:hypothetical protein
MTLILIVLFGVVPGILLSIYGMGQMFTYLKLRQSDTVPVQDLDPPMGAVEISGQARGHEETHRTPFTDQDTLICQWEIEEYQHDPTDDAGSDWEEVDSGELTTPFLIDDGTGTVLVEPAGASLYMRETRTLHGHEADSESFSVSLDSLGVEFHSGSDRRYREYHLGPEDDVHVMGSVQPPPDDLSDSVAGVVRAVDEGGSSVVDAFQTKDFTISNGGEERAEMEVLKYAAIFLGIGVVFTIISVLLILN